MMAEQAEKVTKISILTTTVLGVVEIATMVERNLKAKIIDLTSVVVHIESARGREVGKKR